MRRNVIAGVVSLWLVFMLTVVLVLGSGANGDGEYRMPQSEFPCHEDEVLGYKRGEHDHVVCMHVEEVRG